MAVKKGNQRVMITFNQLTFDKLMFLCKFFDLSKTNTINKLIDYVYEKLK